MDGAVTNAAPRRTRRVYAGLELIQEYSCGGQGSVNCGNGPQFVREFVHGDPARYPEVVAMQTCTIYFPEREEPLVVHLRQAAGLVGRQPVPVARPPLRHSRRALRHALPHLLADPRQDDPHPAYSANQAILAIKSRLSGSKTRIPARKSSTGVPVSPFSVRYAVSKS